MDGGGKYVASGCKYLDGGCKYLDGGCKYLDGGCKYLGGCEHIMPLPSSGSSTSEQRTVWSSDASAHAQPGVARNAVH